MNTQIQPLHRYRATLWPAHIEASDVQEHDDKGVLPTLQFKAPSAKAAIATAAHVSGQRVLRVDRLWDAGELLAELPSTDPTKPAEQLLLGRVTELRITPEGRRSQTNAAKVVSA